MYYLLHYFDPDFSHLHRRPEQYSDGSAELRSLGYVQNVVAGQVLAEILEIGKHRPMRRDPRFIYKTKHLPIGPNCVAHPDNPDKIIAAANGYVFYNKGLISVKKLLNVRGDAGFHTGNIFFVGDLAVHGDVLTGFSLQARNILVKGQIQSAKLKSAGDVVCLGGVKGANTCVMSGETDEIAHSDHYVPSSLIEAEGNIRLPFCEHVQLRARGNIVIDGSCMHSTLYVGGNLLVKGRLQGGAVYANGIVCVEKQLGADYVSPTKIMMGYDPFDFLSLQKLESQIRFLQDKLGYFSKMAARNDVMNLEYAPRTDVMQGKINIARKRRSALWQKFNIDGQKAPHCLVLVPGKVMPGCEIAIGRAFYKTTDIAENINFRLLEHDEEITIRSNK